VIIDAKKISLTRVSGNNFRDIDHGVHSLQYTHLKIVYTLTTLKTHPVLTGFLSF
jgi:hypothetical protein